MTQSIKVAANQSKRTFTIRCYDNGKMYAKYRTNVMSQEEFEQEEFNTEHDWLQFLKTDDYYKIN